MCATAVQTCRAPPNDARLTILPPLPQSRWPSMTNETIRASIEEFKEDDGGWKTDGWGDKCSTADSLQHLTYSFQMYTSHVH